MKNKLSLILFLTVSSLTFAQDADLDGVADRFDNCKFTPNPGQEDVNSNGIGDICEYTPTSGEYVVYEIIASFELDDMIINRREFSASFVAGDPLQPFYDFGLTLDPQIVYRFVNDDSEANPALLIFDKEFLTQLELTPFETASNVTKSEFSLDDGFDTDGDGQIDGDEVECGSDPFRDTSVSPDRDGDGVPDCKDDDGVFSDANSFLSAPDALGDINGDRGTLKVLVRDSSDNPIEGVRVRFVRISGSATILVATGNTDINGEYMSDVVSGTTGTAQFNCRIDTDENSSLDGFVTNGAPTGITFVDDVSNQSEGGGVGINTSEMDPSAILDIRSTDKGVLFPKVSLSSASDKSTIINPSVALMVYNTNQSSSLNVGFVYFDGNKWINM